MAAATAERRRRRGHKLILDVSVDSIQPAREPACLVSIGRRVTNTVGQDSSRGFSKVFCGFTTCAFLGHPFEDLEQTPTLSRISLGRKDTFSLEVHVINQSVTSARRLRHAIELLPHLRSPGRRCFGEHFRKRFLQAFDEKLRLEIDGVREKLAQLLHPNCLACLTKFDARIPRTTSFENQAFREPGSMPSGEINEFRKTLLERAAHAFLGTR